MVVDNAADAFILVGRQVAVAIIGVLGELVSLVDEVAGQATATHVGADDRRVRIGVGLIDLGQAVALVAVDQVVDQAEGGF